LNVKFYFPVDIFDYVTSLARASRSRVKEPARPLHTGSSITVTTVTRVFRRSVGGTALKSTLPKNQFMNRM